jgi:ABC-type lipoprotein release transport system permease subunit
MASDTGSRLEIMMTPDTAQSWHVDVGSSMTISMDYQIRSGPPESFNTQQTNQQAYQALKAVDRVVNIKARVVGLFSVSNSDTANYWHGRSFTVGTGTAGAQQYPIFTFLTSAPVLLHSYDQAAAKSHIDAAFDAFGPFTFYWYHHLDPNKISSTQLGDLTNQLAGLQTDLVKDYGSLETNPVNIPPALPYPYLAGITLSGNVLHTQNQPSTLEAFSSRIDLARIPVVVIAVQIIALILFFVVMMIDLLVDRQQDGIAVLRSRGASGQQIFGALWTQGLWLSLCALIIGMPLALLAVYLFSKNTLDLSQHNALNFITDHPAQTLLAVIPYGLGITIVVIVTMGLALRRAVSMDILSVRREASRNTRQSFWQRLYLDVIAAVIALGAYAVSAYITSASSQLDLRSRSLIATPLTLVTPLFLLLACAILFLRLYPLLLRLAAHLAGQGRGAASMLALAQMSRAPRQSVRMIMLLTFSIAFVIFALTFIATQAQHNSDLANYEVGADLSGHFVAQPDTTFTQQSVQKKLQAQPGIKSASVGVSVQGSAAEGSGAMLMDVRGVDPATFPSTAYWPTQASSQPLSAIMQQLVAQRPHVLPDNAVPVFVDALAWDKLKLHMGSTFVISADSGLPTDMTCKVIGKIAHIPTVNDSQDTVTIAGETPPPGGVLLDYQSFVNYFQHATRGLTAVDNTHAEANFFWLRSTDPTSSAAMTNASHALQQQKLNVDQLNDRQSLLDALNKDPLAVNLSGVLILGIAAILLLAVIGDLLASLLGVHTRRINFAVLRALGTTPTQVAGVLAWEQVIVYVGALALGLLLGAFLAVTLIPNLIFSSAPSIGLLSTLSTTEFYALQHILATPLVISPTLLLTLALLIVVCAVSLVLMVQSVARPAMSLLLRLNDD